MTDNTNIVTDSKKQSFGKIKNILDLQNIINKFESGEKITPKRCNMFLSNRINFYNWIEKCNGVEKLNGSYYKGDDKK